MAFYLILLILSNSPQNTEIVVNVDLIELNHKINLSEDPLPGYYQYIAWNFCPEYRRYNVVRWAMIDDCIFSKQGEYYTLKIRYIGTRKVIIRSKNYIETTTSHDPEKENAKIFPEKFRLRLTE